jgi:hypothetical protein
MVDKPGLTGIQGLRRLSRFWWLLGLQVVTFPVIVVIVVHKANIAIEPSGFVPMLFAAGLVAGLPAMLLAPRFREQVRYLQRQPQVTEFDVQGALQKMLVGIGLADVPAMIGIVLYVLGGEFWQAVMLFLLSFLLVVFYRPAT